MTRRLAVAALGVFAALRIVAATRHPSLYADSPSYDHLSFTGGALRGWTIPLVYNVFTTNDAREVAQIVLGIGCWSVLGVNVGRAAKDWRVAAVGFVLVLLLGLTQGVTDWDAAMMSESIATSLLVLVVALGLRPRADGRWVVSALGVLVAWAFAKSENMLVFLCLVPVLVALAARCLPRRMAAWMAAVLVLLAMWGGYATYLAVGDRPIRTFNAAELAVTRWATQPADLRYMAARGLPVELVKAASRRKFPAAEVWLSRQLRFGAWVSRSFTSAYMGMLAEHAPGSITGPLELLPVTASYPISGYQQSRNVLAVGWLWAAANRAWIVMVAVLVLLTAIARRRMPWVPVLLLVGAGLLSVQAYDLAANDYLRLFQPADLALHLALLVGVVWAADQLAAVKVALRQPVRGVLAHDLLDTE